MAGTVISLFRGLVFIQERDILLVICGLIRAETA